MRYFEKTAISSALIRNAANKRVSDLQFYRKVMSPETTHPEFLSSRPFGEVIGTPLTNHFNAYNAKTQNQLTNIMDRTKDPELKMELAEMLAKLF